MKKIRLLNLLNRPYIFIWIALLLIGGLCVVYRETHLFRKQSNTTLTADTYTKGQPTSTGSTAGQSTSSKGSSIQNTVPPSEVGGSKDNTSSGNSSNSNTQLIKPTGNFVSDHHPNLSGSPAPNTMTSVCTTTPGATCQISFINGTITKTLPDQTTDAGGSAYWNWKLQDLGLTAGSWQIKTTATLNGQSQTAIDAMNLEISQ